MLVLENIAPFSGLSFYRSTRLVLIRRLEPRWPHRLLLYQVHGPYGPVQMRIHAPHGAIGNPNDEPQQRGWGEEVYGGTNMEVVIQELTNELYARAADCRTFERVLWGRHRSPLWT